MGRILAQPKKGEIWKVKLRSGRTWIFESAWDGHIHKTEHQGAYCYDAGGSDCFYNYVTTTKGCHIGSNHEILELRPATQNEIAILLRKLGI